MSRIEVPARHAHLVVAAGFTNEDCITHTYGACGGGRARSVGGISLGDCIKVKLGKLVVRGGVDAARQEILTAIGARELAITSTHALAAADLPALHRDPFDRILVAQTIVEGLVLVTADEMVRQYGVPTQWAL